MNLLIIFSFAIALSACSKGASPDRSSAGLNSEKLAAISKSFCAAGETLVELNLDPVPLPFESLNSQGTLVAFVNGDGACSLSKDINDHWGADWFGLQIHGGCLPNGSFWKITDGYNANDTRYYKLDSADPSGLPTLDMWGSRDLNVAYARDHAGLRVMKCAPVNNKPASFSGESL